MAYIPSVAPGSAFAPWRWAMAGALAGLILALVLFAPARWLAALVRQASGEHVLLDGPRGGFWQGSAQLVLSGGAGSREAVALPGQLTWTIRPAWNGLNVQLNAECCMQQALQLQARPAGWSGVQLTLSDSHSQWPAGLLAGLGTPWNTVQAQGQLAASTQGFNARWVQGRLSLTGRLQLDATRISSRLSTLQPMGSYRLLLQGGNPSTLELNTLEGKLQLTGRGQWVGQRLRFDGAASATPESIDALSNLLNIIGRRNGATAIIKVG
ncbi:type II secretion system protein N [Polaromonas hydrogenivorans]|uniref:Type II secretion system protein N n=1 Tax=Polaromonas hydrogenivorans TaxID=335476 RepID=A0AAU7LPR1_9BURK